MRSDYYIKTWSPDGKVWNAVICQDFKIFGLRVWTDYLPGPTVKDIKKSPYDPARDGFPEPPLGRSGYGKMGYNYFQDFKTEELAMRAALTAIEELKDYKPIKINVHR